MGLTEAQLADIAGLAAACERAEGLSMRLNWTALQHRPGDRVDDFLYYDDAGRLVGFLPLHHFMAQEAEATAMTHPDCRRRGIFRRLLAAALDELRARHVPAVLLMADRASPAMRPVMATLGAHYDHSEYLMEVEPDQVQLAPDLPEVALRRMVHEDLPAMARLDEEAFGVPAGDNRYLEEALGDEEQWVWIAMLYSEPVGKIHGQCTPGDNQIYGFSIMPEYRGRGYGKVVLSMAMSQLLAARRQKISLEVAADNDQALNLYRGRGFEVVTAYDYYRLSV